MYRSVEAIVEPSGTVRLLEVVRLDRPCRAVVTLLASADHEAADAQGNTTKLLRFLQRSRLPDHARLSENEIEAQINAERGSWD